MSLTRFALRHKAPVPELLSFDRFLFVGPHPDDIELGAGATAARLASMGKKLLFLVCTDGRYGFENAPEGMTVEKLIPLRRSEAIASAKVLGAEGVRFLNFIDGGGYEFDLLLRQIAWEIGRFQPQVLFAPDPCVDSECHADHLNTGNAVRQLAFFAPFKEIMARYGAESAPVEALAYYMTARPNQFVNITGFTQKQEEAIFSCHQSQFPPESAAASELRAYLKLRSVDFGLRALCGRAEGFRVLGRTQMHCMPEAGL